MTGNDNIEGSSPDALARMTPPVRRRFVKDLTSIGEGNSNLLKIYVKPKQMRVTILRHCKKFSIDIGVEQIEI